MHTVIVGAGSAGAVIASRLTARRAHEVTLVEAGPDYPTVATTPRDLRDGRRNSMRDHDWGYRLRPTPQQRVPFDFPRGRVVGGSSAVNTCIALRGHPYDFDEWASRGLDGWSFRDCLPAFKRLEHDLDFDDEWHGRDGPIPIRRHKRKELARWQAGFLEAARAFGHAETIDHNNPELPCGFGPHAMNRVAGERMSASRCYLGPEVRRRENLRILAGRHAASLVFRGERCVGVVVLDERGRAETIEAERVVLSAGAVGSLGVLLRSGIGPRAELDRLGVAVRVDSPSVGRRLLDHPGVAIILAPRLGVASAEDPLLQVMVRHTSRGSEHPFDLATQPGSNLPLAGLVFPLVTMMTTIGKPRGSGTIHFASKDPRAKPIVDMRFLDHPEDMARALEAMEHLWALARTAPLRDLAFPLYPSHRALTRPERLREVVPLVCGSGYHPCGTVPMSRESIEEGAVDARGRVRGVSGLHVADASIMPTIPSANTNLATLMIGERFGEWLAAES